MIGPGGNWSSQHRAVYEEVNRFLVGLMLPSSGEAEGEFDVVAGYNPHISQPLSLLVLLIPSH